MSSIYKLSISGIRSFDPGEVETIQFNKPLTLIVGANGSGKTTIIECLKYAATGDLPPNSKGGAFIHDPNIAGERDVRAQIKLAFKNVNNKTMVLTRTLQLISKGKSQSTFKTLENQLYVLNHGERTTISSKAAEVDSLIPQNLGVSKAILNYVIFCHQEDSSWPISEPSILKKRFDEIFDSVKFIKVLDNFKDIRKQFDIDIKLLHNNVKHLKEDRKRANAKKFEMEQLIKTVDEYKLEIGKISLELKDITQQMDKLFKSNQDYEKVINRIDFLKNQQITLNSQIQRIKQSLIPLPNTIEDLQNKLINFNEILNEKKTAIENKRAIIKLKTDELNVVRASYSTNIRIEGQLRALFENYKLNIEKRFQIIKENYENLDLSIHNIEDDKVILEFKDKIMKKLITNEKKLKEIIDDNNFQIQEYESNLTMIRDSKMKEEQHLQYYETDLKNYHKENDSLNFKIRMIQSDETKITSEIHLKNEEIICLEKELEEITNQISVSSRQSETLAKSSIIKQNIHQNENIIKSIIDANGKAFKEKVGIDLNIETCEKDCSNRLLSLKEVYKKEQNIYEQYNLKTYQLDRDRESLKDQISILGNELKLKKQKVEEMMQEDFEISDYEDTIDDLEKNYKIALENLNFNDTTIRFNMNALAIAEKEKHCVLCRRTFKNGELSTFLDLLRESISPRSQQNAKEEFDRIKEDLEYARALGPDILRIRSLENVEINEANLKLNVLNADYDSAKKRADEQLKSLENLESEIYAVESFFKIVADLTRLNKELESYKGQLSAIQNELTEFGASNHSINELQILQNKSSSAMKVKRQELSHLTQTKEIITRELTKLETTIKDKRLRIGELEKNLSEKVNLKKSIQENEAKLKSLENNISKTRSMTEDLAQKYNIMVEKFKELKKRNEEKELEQKAKVDYLSNISTRFNELNDIINNYLGNDSPKLEKCEQDLKSIESKIKELESQIETLSSEIIDIDKSVNVADQELRNIRDNIDFRNLQVDLESVKQETAELTLQNTESERNKYTQEASRLQKLYSDLQAQHSGKNGEITQLTIQIENLRNELKRDYNKVDEKYEKEYIKLQTKFFLSNDLSVYSKALDNAVMKYHSVKMQEINRIIDELWKTTYSGTDVDNILIKSESNSSNVKSGNRSYNYRVVMVKQGVELDMRGRCSAGQKVLASIIIRLALAECFGINCGMIALDEPTTNLDEDNIESLARALNNIIELRKKQKNFQLIVITHDEKFLSNMNAAQFTDQYYRVKRNASQKSQIEAVPIAVINA
ncbi:hypothetical protein PACTADRAFT_2916 [Pachysolen tannophilus NRRL Y-2460]|uniref:DNA repair protein RAD50 n=1 Tax=Pachysolen tannophilus NRRL Y-2460 TaxID=669874 RepID=A0A1E4TTZ2_PACTA|nr:hypothetical protein PACTADRAFT_2916 [Pachysolen tannophilus NRRL Y-2460]